MRVGGRLAAVAVAGSALIAGAAFGPRGMIVGTAPAGAVLTGAAAPTGPSASCHMANGVQHVIEITFDNLHFNRDNPQVLSDIEQMPALQGFITGKGTLLSNNHTPLIAHTANDTITNYTGLYGDRHGLGISNDYEAYQPNGSVSSQSAFGYWTASGADQYPNMAYSASVPAAGAAPATPPAPWVPFTRAGCDFGAVSTSNMELENTNPDLANVFGASSPEVAQLNADPDSFKDQETNDYVGLGVHCAQGDSLCANAQAVKYGQSAPSSTQAADVLPSEPGGYNGYDAVFGHRYLQPVLAGAANAAGGVRITANGDRYQITNSAGNLVDLNGKEIDGQYVHTAGFPGFGPISAAQSLAYVADMQESGVPVTYAYISDAHEKKFGDKGCSNPSGAEGPGDPCYKQNLANYNAAFASFFTRLGDDGINASNTLFVFTADEGDHFVGANVGRSVTPNCTGTAGTAGYTCSYAGTIGEQSVDIHDLLSKQQTNNTGFYDEPQGNSVYITGQPGQSSAATRQLERDFAAATVNDAWDGGTPENVAQYFADPNVEALLHFADADTNRTPSFTVFPKPDFYLASGTDDSCAKGTTKANAAANCVFTDSFYAWDHGYYAPEINNTWLGLVGPGVAHSASGIDGSSAAGGPNSSGGANSSPQLDTSVNNPGTWADHTDIRPTIMALTGLTDDYVGDGRVLTEDLTVTPGATGDSAFQPLAVCYKQLNSSVGRFGTDVLVADTKAIKTGSPSNDSTYQSVSSQIASLGAQRDALAGQVKQDLFNAEFQGTALANGSSELSSCESLLSQADQLAGG